MARSDLNPILREMVADDTTTASIDWSWSCFHCHGASTGQNTSVVFCICKTLKSTLYRRAFYASRRLEAAAACNLEYRKQRNDRTSTPLPPHLQQTFEVPDDDDDDDDDDDRLRSLIQLRPTRHKSCYDCIVSASSSSLSSCTALSSFKSSRTHTFSKSSDANRTGCGDHPHKDNYTRCDNKSYNCHSSRVTSFCLCNRLHPNDMTSPDISQVTHLHHRNYHNQQQQQQHRSRSDKGLIRCDIDNRTIIESYTRCKLDHRSYEDLKTLIENFTKQVQAVSEDLVKLLEERHDVKQQIDMRNIAIEQLLRLQQDDDWVAMTTNESTASNKVAAAAVDRADEEELGVGTIDAQQQQQQQQQNSRDILRMSESETQDYFFTTLRTIMTPD